MFGKIGYFLLICLGLGLLSGCAVGPHVLPLDEQKTVDRGVTEYPAGYVLQPYMVNLQAPVGFAFDTDGTVVVAEGGIDGDEPRLYAVKPDGNRLDIYPHGTRIPVVHSGFHIFGPVGGITIQNHRIFISHHDQNGMGAITAFEYNGTHATIVADLPAQGDYGLTDIAVSPINGRLYFGLGSATNSGVVGDDNPWIETYPDCCDLPYQQIELPGQRFDVHNPHPGLFTGPDILVTGAFQPLGHSNKITIPKAPLGRPTGAIYSVSPEGGDLRVEAWGVRNPAGFAISELGVLYFTDQGMELRGTRPIKDDPDVLFRFVPGRWYGWPDYSRDLLPIRDARFQPPTWMILDSGYPTVSPLIDHVASDLPTPDRSRWITGAFSPLAGASKMDFVPNFGPFKQYRGSLIVALWGDRAPFATTGMPLKSPPPGYKLVICDPDTREIKNFIYNTLGGPASTLDNAGTGLERPIDAKFNPADGTLYILDFGYSRMKGSREVVKTNTGRIFRLLPLAPQTPPAPTTQK